MWVPLARANYMRSNSNSAGSLEYAFCTIVGAHGKHSSRTAELATVAESRLHFNGVSNSTDRPLPVLSTGVIQLLASACREPFKGSHIRAVGVSAPPICGALRVVCFCFESEVPIAFVWLRPARFSTPLQPFAPYLPRHAMPC